MSGITAGETREFAFDAQDFTAISQLLQNEAGIVLSSAKTQLVYSRIAKRVRGTAMRSFRDYLSLIERDPAERAEAIYALTTNHTSFFREDHHFDHLAETSWPPLARRLEQGGRVRIWSSACSSGEEPLTIAMTLLGRDRGAAARLSRQDFSILATDLSLPILETARAGSYPKATMAKVPAALRDMWLRRDGDTMVVDPALLDLIRYRQLNLLEDWPIRGKFDIIFCRNVMIYFDEPTKDRLQTRLAAHLAPGGFLYIGHSERLADPLVPHFRLVGRTIYQKGAA